MALYMCEHTLSNIGISSLRVIVGEEKEKKKKKREWKIVSLALQVKEIWYIRLRNSRGFLEPRNLSNISFLFFHFLSLNC